MICCTLTVSALRVGASARLTVLPSWSYSAEVGLESASLPRINWLKSTATGIFSERATGTLDGIIEAGMRYDLPEVAKAYETIVKDERFHVGLGRLLLDRYVETEADLSEVMRAMHGMAAIVRPPEGQ